MSGLANLLCHALKGVLKGLFNMSILLTLGKARHVFQCLNLKPSKRSLINEFFTFHDAFQFKGSLSKMYLISNTTIGAIGLLENVRVVEISWTSYIMYSFSQN